MTTEALIASAREESARRLNPCADEDGRALLRALASRLEEVAQRLAEAEAENERQFEHHQDMVATYASKHFAKGYVAELLRGHERLRALLRHVAVEEKGYWPDGCYQCRAVHQEIGGPNPGSVSVPVTTEADGTLHFG